MDFFGRSFFGRYSILSARPLTEIDQFAALAAKRPVGIACIFGFLLASWAFHHGG